MCESPSTIVKTISLENRSAERESSPEFRNLAGGNPMQPENQTFIPNQFKIGIKRPEDQPPQPELRNLAGGKPSLQAESGTQKPNLFEDSGKGPTPVYKMDKDDWEHRGTYCPDGPAQVPLYQTRAIKEAESCHLNSQPNVHNSRQW